MRAEAQDEKLRKKYAAIQLLAKVGYFACAVGLLGGAFDYFILGDEHNGIGVTLASLLMAPIIWVGSYVRKAVWRFALRA